MRSDIPDTRSSSSSSSSVDSAHASTQATACDTLAVDWDVSAVDGTTLVSVRVTNTLEHPRQLRIDNRLDGPVSPPRRRGTPDATAELHWDADGVSVSVAPGETVSVGYACCAPPQTPPVTVHDGADVSGPSPVERALRSLDDHAPPRAVVSPEADSDPTVDSGTDADGDDERVGHSTGELEDEDEFDDDDGEDFDDGEDDFNDDEGEDFDDDEDENDDDAKTDTPEPTGGESDACGRPAEATDSAASPSTPPSGSDDLPHTIDAWFGAVEARLDTAERLSGPVQEATPVIASLGGRGGLETLAATMESDARALSRVAERATVLADRLDETAVSTVEAER